MHEHPKKEPPANETDATAGRPGAPEPDPPKDAPKPGLNYVFKIAPADPKNSLDFEDVADK